jgi:hypothetical protein
LAKRFTDTDKWKKPWFRKLPLKMKAAWIYICDNCDHAGVWPADFDLLSFQIGEVVTEMDFRAHFEGRFEMHEGGKISFPSFIEFQYGELNPDNRTHKSVISILTKLAPSKPLPSSSQGAKDKDKDKDTGSDKGSAQEKENSDLKTEIKQLGEAWLETLAHFGMGREKLLAHEDYRLGSAIQQREFRPTYACLIGARHQKKSASWDPAQFLSLDFCLNPKNFDRLFNLGVQALREGKATAPWMETAKVES